MADSGSLPNGITYQWNTDGCYNNSQFTGSNPECFPHGQTTQSVTGNNLNAEDAGIITCTVTISGSDYTSEPFTLRISGEQLVYCVITCIVYCKQCMLLLLATCYCCIVHQLLWFMYRGVFTVGVAVTRNSLTDATDFLTDYSYITASDNPGSGVVLARCATGLGPNGTSINANSELGGWYFDNGTMIPNSGVFQGCGSPANSDYPAVGPIQARPGFGTAGVINLRQCDPFIIALEGIYTCIMMNSSMMNQSVRVGVYFTGRSESLDIYISSLNHLSSLYTAAPVIDPISPNTMTVNVGDPLTLSCTSRGSPPDTFTWRNDNGPLLQSTTTPVTYNDNSAVFRADYSIDSVTTSDSGTYTCTVTNLIGSYSATITVNVISKLLIYIIFRNLVM